MSDSPITQGLSEIGLEILAPPGVALLGGLLLILFGRRLYWLLVGVAAFALGAYFFLRWVDFEPGLAVLILGAVAGLVCAALVVLFQKVAVAAVGFLAAALVMIHFAVTLDWTAGHWVWIAAVIAGIAGAFVARSLFELALIVLTSIVGSALIVMTLTLAPAIESLLFVILIVVGILAQSTIARKGRAKG